MQNIRNFSIIAHIDHGKSTLADKIIELAKAIEDRQKANQILDNMDIERERGITIKAQSVRLNYNFQGQEYILNLIDTPGHVDFSFEVSKSLYSSEGALLVVDAAQGVQAQTIANVYLAVDNDLEILPVINKIDLPSANIPAVKDEIEKVIGIDCEDVQLVSAKSGLGIKKLIEYIIKKVPAPKGAINASLEALIYDSWFDNYLGGVALVRVLQGVIRKRDQIKIISTDQTHEVLELMYPKPLRHEKTASIQCGEIGIVVLGLKDASKLQVGDTLTSVKDSISKPSLAFSKVLPFVFAGLYPIETDKFELLREALDKLKLNDSAIVYDPESSAALGFGFRTGFLGLLHMEVVKERLEREFNIDLIATAPTVVYHVYTNDGQVIKVQSPTELPPPQNISKIEEPYVKATIMTPKEYLGNIIYLLNSKRGIQESLEYINETRVLLQYAVPMNEIIIDFYDKLKSISKGYASFDYEIYDYRVGHLIRLDIRVAGELVDALSLIVPKTHAETKARSLVKAMKELIDSQLFEVAIQASIGSKVIARETVKAIRKNVTAKCYGGDITRKRKLLEKQKAGKKRMKAIGRVNIPSQAFLSILKID